jgi:hypothetical protein
MDEEREMIPTIVTPKELKDSDLVYEAELDLVLEDRDHHKGGMASEMMPEIPAPVVSLGRPIEWNLAHLAREKGEQLPAELSLQLREADFYLLQLACSFRPSVKSRITWARLQTQLQPENGTEAPIAFDLYPLEIYDESRRDVKVSISPALRFTAFEAMGVEGRVGEILMNLEIKKLEPVIIGYGALESTPNWDFFAHEHYPLLGSKFCYLIVKKPRSAKAVRLALNVTAEFETNQGLFRAKIARRDRGQLRLVMCDD